MFYTFKIKKSKINFEFSIRIYTFAHLKQLDKGKSVLKKINEKDSNILRGGVPIIIGSSSLGSYPSTGGRRFKSL